jgi:hypothetical protein
MAKDSHKRSTLQPLIPGADQRPGAWLPVAATAMSGIKEAVGAWDLMLAVLEQRAQNGSFRGVARRVISEGQNELPAHVWQNADDPVAPRVTREGGVEERELRPSFWRERPNGDRVRLQHRSFFVGDPARDSMVNPQNRRDVLQVVFESQEPKRSENIQGGIYGYTFLFHRDDLAAIWPGVIASLTPPAAPTAAAVPTEPTAVTAKALPETRPKGIGPKVWLAAKEVFALQREGDPLGVDLETLLRKVCKRIGDNRVSLRTLKNALHYLRRNKLIDR